MCSGTILAEPGTTPGLEVPHGNVDRLYVYMYNVLKKNNNTVKPVLTLCSKAPLVHTYTYLFVDLGASL